MATLVMAPHKSVVEFGPLTFQIFNIEMGPSIRVNLGCEEKQRGDIGAALETVARISPGEGEKLARAGARVALPNQIGTTVIIEVKHSWTLRSLNYSEVASITGFLDSYVVGAANCLKPSI
jgi:hypothetical protein